MSRGAIRIEPVEARIGGALNIYTTFGGNFKLLNFNLNAKFFQILDFLKGFLQLYKKRGFPKYGKEEAPIWGGNIRESFSLGENKKGGGEGGYTTYRQTTTGYGGVDITHEPNKRRQQQTRGGAKI